MMSEVSMAIDDFDVSEKWKERFEIFEKCGARDGYKTYSKNFKSLESREVFSIYFNIWAFIFWPYYYFVKKMWHKGFVLLGLPFLVGNIATILEFLIKKPIPNIIPMGGGVAVCAVMANYDYYRKTVCSEKMWKTFSIFSNLLIAILFAIINFAVRVIIVSLMEARI
ncbi:DUF2628 domain-containing protein [bacterium]